MTANDPINDPYLVAFDPDTGYCRLFREDSPESVGLEPLWTGRGLRRGYDAMIRLNNERRPPKLYRICSRRRTGGPVAYRIFKAEEPKGWKIVEMASDYASARAALKGLIHERDEEDRLAREAEAAEQAADLARSIKCLDYCGVPVRGPMPRVSAADRRYMDWLVETGRVAA